MEKTFVSKFKTFWNIFREKKNFFEKKIFEKKIFKKNFEKKIFKKKNFRKKIFKKKIFFLDVSGKNEQLLKKFFFENFFSILWSTC